MTVPDAVVEAVARDGAHRFSKPTVDEIVLRAGFGVEGDAHYGVTVQHRSRVRRDPTQPNLRQVHLVGAELLERLVADGFDVAPGVVGENITTRGVELLALPVGAVLRIGDSASVELTGLRNPCLQLDHYQRGLQKAVLDRDADGALIRLAGVMGVVLADGAVRPGDRIAVKLPDGEHRPLDAV